MYDSCTVGGKVPQINPCRYRKNMHKGGWEVNGPTSGDPIAVKAFHHVCILNIDKHTLQKTYSNDFNH